MRQMNLYYPQVKHVVGEASSNTINGGAPLISFDLHYSSDEDMTGGASSSAAGMGLKKIKVPAGMVK